ncbi:hypothetical protein FisN_9Lh132 [Fistulifera solaris]|uniref:Uncharacterized protein n=1 Tax=Fistulifera solaris TaxID=1519565 RepID=A0A1Z5KLF4_FISSO|nr:hypothetical protein FisN_9Lh132 [Fistulifera solaris]|eukprot:GAX26851.1 hypothetical protein FisN_9Lh132 [Fistulifera solaris]
MKYSIKRLREEGHFCLSCLDDVESLDVFWAEANKVERLYIEDTGVYVAPSKTKIFEGELVGLSCRRNGDFATELQFVGKVDDIASLRSVAFRVLCLHDTDPQQLEIQGNSAFTKDALILTPEQLRHIICNYSLRKYSFCWLSISAEQSVELVSHRKFEIDMHACHFEDKGQAIVDWLESQNGKEIFPSTYFPHCNCVTKLIAFLSRAKHPVFERLYLCGPEVAPQLSLLTSKANVRALVVDVRFFVFDRAGRSSVLEALRNGTFRPETLEISRFYDWDRDEARTIGQFMGQLLNAIASPYCNLRELHLKQISMRSIARDLEQSLLTVLRNNHSLEVLGIYSNVSPLEFPTMKILNAASQHSYLRKISFYPPTTRPPEIGRPFRTWLQNNFSIDIQFKDYGEIEKQPHLEKWKNAVFSVFTTQMETMLCASDLRIRSHLLVMALRTCHYMPDRMYYLLCRNIRRSVLVCQMNNKKLIGC